MENESVRCQVCKEQEGIVTDYRIKAEIASTVTYKTPLEWYDKYVVCAKCFKLTDKLFHSMLRNRTIPQEEKVQNNAI